MDDIITIEECITRLDAIRHEIVPDSRDHFALSAGIAALYEMENGAPAVNHWIPCSERMPNEAGEYLVCGIWSGEKPKTWICQFIILGDVGGFANPAKNPPISFWMPLPEPPKE